MNSSDEIRKQWHGPFCSAMRLELRDNREDIDFHNEYNLSSKPLQIDLLIIRKLKSVSTDKKIIIDNEIGRIFRGHNILEYKSPGDDLNIDTYFKVLGYACFYKSSGEPVDSIKEDDITISLVREGYPRALMKYFQACSFETKQKYSGIYYVTGGIFPIQVIVSGELDRKLHLWLTSLTRNMQETQAENLVLKMSRLSLKSDRKNADSILDLAMRANPELFHKVKEENPMCEALLELMKPEMDAAVNAAVSAAVNAAVEDTTDVIQAKSVDIIIKNYGGSLEKACHEIGISPEKYRKVKAASQKKAVEEPEILPFCAKNHS